MKHIYKIGLARGNAEDDNLTSYVRGQKVTLSPEEVTLFIYGMKTRSQPDIVISYDPTSTEQYLPRESYEVLLKEKGDYFFTPKDYQDLWTRLEDFFYDHQELFTQCTHEDDTMMPGTLSYEVEEKKIYALEYEENSEVKPLVEEIIHMCIPRVSSDGINELFYSRLIVERLNKVLK